MHLLLYPRIYSRVVLRLSWLNSCFSRNCWRNSGLTNCSGGNVDDWLHVVGTRQSKSGILPNSWVASNNYSIDNSKER